MVSNENSTVSNTSGSALKVVVVPFRSPCGPIFRTGVVGTPRAYSWAHTEPSLADSTRSHSDRALTTLTPTP